MKIHLLSDLHLEFSEYRPMLVGMDVIVLAGDIGVGMQGIEFAMSLLKTFKGHIIYLCGNHEFYRNDIHTLRRAMRDYCSAPINWSGDASENRLHFLDNDEVVININGELVRFLGCTLWTNFELFGESHKPFCMIDGGRCLNDFKLIYNGDRNVTPEDSVELHEESVKWLEMKLKQNPLKTKTIVVTHHAPSFQSVVPRYQDDRLSACFASNLDHLLGFSKLWLHGHMHSSLDYTVNGTRVVCNPRGYARYDRNENGNFDPSLIIEV